MSLVKLYTLNQCTFMRTFKRNDFLKFVIYRAIICINYFEIVIRYIRLLYYIC